MTKREAAIIELYTDTVMLIGDDRKHIYEYAKELLGRPIHTYELISLWDELRNKTESDFINLCRNLSD